MRNAAILTLFAISAVFAEISPKYYREWQQQAPERLRIKIEKVESDPCNDCDRFKTRVNAEVVRVIRSKAGLRTGNKIFMEYEVFVPRRGWVGPRPMPVLNVGTEYDFFGSKTDVNKEKGVIVTPGARGYSFDSLIEGQ